MEENKYYTPNIKDFRVGYECEVNWNRGYENDFIPIKLKICDDLGNGKRDCYCSNVEEVLIAYDDGYAEFRTSYLIKEQIENEGWKETSKYNYEKINSNITMYYGEDHYLWIMHPAITELGEKYKANSFKGNCSSINEFRYISKLLNI